VLLIPAAAASCSRGEERVPTFPVQGELFVGHQPAEGATVILRPNSAAEETAAAVWTSGFPRATVQSGGAFTVGTYESSDGAPAGEYVILVQWPTVQVDHETSESTAEGIDDRLQGRYLDPQKSRHRVVIKQEPNDLGRIELD
jgi:hypothetical protein